MLVYLDWTGDDGKLGRLDTGAHVEDHVLMADVGQGPDIRQPGLDLFVIPGGAAVDDDLSMPPALVDGGLGTSLDHLSKLQLTVFDPELSQEDVDHFVGVGPGQGAEAVGEHGAVVAGDDGDGAGAVPSAAGLLVLAVHRLGEVVSLVPVQFPPPIRLLSTLLILMTLLRTLFTDLLILICDSPRVESKMSLRSFTRP